MRINEIINETTSSGGIATVAMPMTKMVRRPSPVTKKKKKKKVSETFVISHKTEKGYVGYNQAKMVASWLLNKQKDLGVSPNDYNIVDTKTDKSMTGSQFLKKYASLWK